MENDAIALIKAQSKKNVIVFHISEELRSFWKGFVIRSRIPIPVMPERDYLFLVATKESELADKTFVWAVKNSKTARLIVEIPCGWGSYPDDEELKAEEDERANREVEEMAVAIITGIESYVYDHEGKGDAMLNVHLGEICSDATNDVCGKAALDNVRTYAQVV